MAAIPLLRETCGSKGGDVERTGREMREAQGGWGGFCWSTLRRVSLPPAPGCPQGMLCPGRAAARSKFLPRLNASLCQCDPLGMAGLGELGKLSHARSVRVPPCSVSALLAPNNLSKPACIQDMVSIRSPNSQLKLAKLLGTSPSNAKARRHGSWEGKNYSLIRQHLFSVGTGQCRGAWCCTDTGAKVALLFLCSFSACSQALQMLRSSSQSAPGRVSIPADGGPKIYSRCPPKHWDSPCFIHQGGETREFGIRPLPALPLALNPIFF